MNPRFQEAEAKRLRKWRRAAALILLVPLAAALTLLLLWDHPSLAPLSALAVGTALAVLVEAWPALRQGPVPGPGDK